MEVLTEITSMVGENFSTDPLYAKIDNELVIVKSINNPQEFYALFNEAMGYQLAEKLEIPKPKFGFALFKENYTKNHISNEITFYENDFFTYTKMENAVTQIENPSLTDNVDINEIVKLIIFDVFISNEDRNKGNLLLKMPKRGGNPSLFPIDYTHIFPGQCIWFDILKQPFPSIQEITERVFSFGGHQKLIENKVFTDQIINLNATNFKEKLQNIDITDTIESVPYELIKKYDPEDIVNLTSYLNRNIQSFDDIIDEIKKYLVR